MNKIFVVSTGGELLVRVAVRPPLRRYVGNRAFQDFQQCLLHTFTRNVTGDRGVLVFTAQLVDLIDVDDSFAARAARPRRRLAAA